MPDSLLVNTASLLIECGHTPPASRDAWSDMQDMASSSSKHLSNQIDDSKNTITCAILNNSLLDETRRTDQKDPYGSDGMKTADFPKHRTERNNGARPMRHVTSVLRDVGMDDGLKHDRRGWRDALASRQRRASRRCRACVYETWKSCNRRAQQ